MPVHPSHGSHQFQLPDVYSQASRNGCFSNSSLFRDIETKGQHLLGPLLNVDFEQLSKHGLDVTLAELSADLCRLESTLRKISAPRAAMGKKGNKLSNACVVYVQGGCPLEKTRSKGHVVFFKGLAANVHSKAKGTLFTIDFQAGLPPPKNEKGHVSGCVFSLAWL